MWHCASGWLKIKVKYCRSVDAVKGYEIVNSTSNRRLKIVRWLLAGLSTSHGIERHGLSPQRFRGPLTSSYSPRFRSSTSALFPARGDQRASYRGTWFDFLTNSYPSSCRTVKSQYFIFIKLKLIESIVKTNRRLTVHITFQTDLFDAVVPTGVGWCWKKNNNRRKKNFNVFPIERVCGKYPFVYFGIGGLKNGFFKYYSDVE